jgi:hypothetical protein
MPQKKIEIAVLVASLRDNPWQKSLEVSSSELQYVTIDMLEHDWLRKCQQRNYQIFLLCPIAENPVAKSIYDERLLLLTAILAKKTYPTPLEYFIYENKRQLANWLSASSIPHAITNTFTNRSAALQFSKNTKYPLVAKTSLGAGGSGIKILESRNKCKAYVEAAFSQRGIPLSWKPNFRKVGVKHRIITRLKHPGQTLAYFIGKRKRRTQYAERGFVIFQEYVNIKKEWRIVRVGDSFFGHVKLADKRNMHSGTSLVSWEKPSPQLLNLVKEITDTHNFRSQAFDIFETPDGQYLINECQTFFGSHNPHQMIIDEEPGRYIWVNGFWQFESGDFNRNNSYDLRLADALDQVK